MQCCWATQFATAGHQDTQLMGLLVKVFKKTSFKDWQLRIISATLGGKNTLVVQPTGSGKSLCFQFPCMVTRNVTIIFMPTISLILDQTNESTRGNWTQKHFPVMNRIAQAQFDIILTTLKSFFDKSSRVETCVQESSSAEEDRACGNWWGLFSAIIEITETKAFNYDECVYIQHICIYMFFVVDIQHVGSHVLSDWATFFVLLITDQHTPG